jgi:hypothetical protein
MAAMSLSLYEMMAQVVWGLIIAFPVAICSWTIAKEEVFAWLRWLCHKALDWGDRHGLCGKIAAKPFYMPTCEFCTSFWVTFFFVDVVTPFRMLTTGWKGWMVGEFFVMAWANVYMSIYSRIRVEITKDKTITENINGGNSQRGPDLHGRGVQPKERDRVG